MTATVEELTEVRDIGSEVASSIVRFFTQPENQRVIQQLLDAGFQLKVEKRATGKLEGLTFVLTGALATMSRSEAQKRITALGGRVVSSVSNKTDYVVIGEAPGSKAVQARELGVEVVDEDRFQAMIGS